MNNKHNNILAAIVALVIASGMAANVAQASDLKDKDAKELQLFSQAKISLTEAIKAAEQKTGGKAMEAEIDDESGAVQFEIEVAKDDKIHKVMVDGKTGNVLKVSLDDESDEGSENE
jgi:uncharacterized membrane protein YkoI